jgi:hypothetical protein
MKVVKKERAVPRGPRSMRRVNKGKLSMAEHPTGF